MAVSESTPATGRTVSYWHSVRRLTMVLGGAWFAVTLTVIFFARELSAYTILGWPFSFYMAAQGSTIVYVIIIGLYAWRMQALDGLQTSSNTGSNTGSNIGRNADGA